MRFMPDKGVQNLGSKFNSASFEREFKDLTRYKKSIAPHAQRITQTIKQKNSYATALKRGGLSSGQIREIVKESRQAAKSEGKIMSSFAAKNMERVMNEYYGKDAFEQTRGKSYEQQSAASQAKDRERRKSIIDSIFSRPKEEIKPIKRDIIRAGRVNLKTGEYQEEKDFKSSVSISQRPPGIMAGGLKSNIEDLKKSSAGSLGGRNNAMGIKGAPSGGFKTIGSFINKK